VLKKNVRDHSAKKNPGSAEFFKKQRRERNLARGPQRTEISVQLNADGTTTDIVTRERL